MAQNTQNLKAEIISALDSLPLDSLKLLAKFVAFLRTGMVQEESGKTNFETLIEIPQKTLRISSPRLAHREQIVDFKKEVIWETADDSL